MLNTQHVEQLLESTRAFAQSRGLLEQFERKLDYLANYASRPGDTYGPPNSERTTICVLHRDRAPHSFGLTMLKPIDGPGELDLYPGYAMMWCGGLIYFGQNESGAGFPQLSTRMPGDTAEGWEVHT